MSQQQNSQDSNPDPYLIGILEEKYDTQEISATFKKREFVLKIEDDYNGNTYTNYIKMQLVQNRVGLIDGYVPGDAIRVRFNYRGNRYEKDGKVGYITNLDAWKIEDAPQGYAPYAGPVAATSQQPPATAQGNFSYNPNPEQKDDLPF